MKNFVKGLMVMIAAATPAFANGGSSGANSLLLSAFFGFAALIVVFQFVPALVLFGGMLKGLFSSAAPAPKK